MILQSSLTQILLYALNAKQGQSLTNARFVRCHFVTNALKERRMIALIFEPHVRMLNAIKQQTLHPLHLPLIQQH
jgi:hypothetical protein